MPAIFPKAITSPRPPLPGNAPEPVEIICPDCMTWHAPPRCRQDPLAPCPDCGRWRDDAGKIKYVAIVEFKDKPTRDRWSSAIIEAMRAAHPEVLAEVGTAL